MTSSYLKINACELIAPRKWGWQKLILPIKREKSKFPGKPIHIAKKIMLNQ